MMLNAVRLSIQFKCVRHSISREPSHGRKNGHRAMMMVVAIGRGIHKSKTFFFNFNQFR
jgi:hypothetical protein